MGQIIINHLHVGSLHYTSSGFSFEGEGLGSGFRIKGSRFTPGPTQTGGLKAYSRV